MSTITSHPLFDSRDLEQLRRHGVSVEDAAAQIALLRRGPAAIVLDRPATVGDGIERLGERGPALEQGGREAARAGRASYFVPASGAATRMFAELTAGPPEAARRFLEALPRLALREPLAAELMRRGHSLERLATAGQVAPILEALLAADGLGLANLPKALVPFHRGPNGVRTALDEHLEDATALITDDQGACRLHFTVSHEHEHRFADAARASAAGIEARVGVHFELTFSTQSPATDCLAATPEGEPFRGRDGALLFRPGGHGALLSNLGGAGGDLVLCKTVDNVQAASGKFAAHQWAPRVIGRLAELARATASLLGRLDDPADTRATDDALRFAADTFGRTRTAPSSDPWVRARFALDRPIRVCGMVPNVGEPGGAPFWVRGADDSVSLQIVEGAQVAPDQREIFRRATHFNPVFMACALRGRRGRPFELERFVDREAVIVTRRTWDDRELVALERPGLWNGGMAEWNTVFVEVPLETFTPVKTVFDLLRPEHLEAGPQ